jgi:hypothetical protein
MYCAACLPDPGAGVAPGSAANPQMAGPPRLMRATALSAPAGSSGAAQGTTGAGLGLLTAAGDGVAGAGVGAAGAGNGDAAPGLGGGVAGATPRSYTCIAGAG